MPIVEGSMPLALPGGAASASRPAAPAKRPLIERTPAAPKIAFPNGEFKKSGGAFHKRGATAFPHGF